MVEEAGAGDEEFWCEAGFELDSRIRMHPPSINIPITADFGGLRCFIHAGHKLLVAE
jgi:hypothetical protein